MASRETLIAIWKDMGIDGGIKNDALDQIAIYTEFSLRSLVEEAASVMRLHKTANMTTNHVNIAMKNLDIEPILGYNTNGQDYGLLKRNKVGQPIPEKTLNLRDLSASDLPPPVEEQQISLSWMLLDDSANQPATEESGKAFTPAVAESAAGVWRKIVDPYSETASSLANRKTPVSVGGGLLQASLATLLSKEQRVFLDSVKNAIRAVQLDADREFHPKTFVILRALRSGGGLGQLLPFLSQYLAETILLRTPHTSPACIRTCLRALRALLSNPLANCAPYLHQLLHPLLSLSLGPQNCQPEQEEEYLAIRASAANALAVSALHAASRGAHLASLPSLILGAFTDVLDAPLDSVSGGEVVGALEGIVSLGPRAAQLLAPRVLRQILLFLSSVSTHESSAHAGDAAETNFALHSSMMRIKSNADGSVSVTGVKSVAELLAPPVIPFLPNLRVLTGADRFGHKFEAHNIDDKASEAEAMERLRTAVLDVRAEATRREVLRTRIVELVMKLVLLAVSPLSLEMSGLQGINSFAAAPPLSPALLEHTRCVLSERVVYLSVACSRQVNKESSKPRIGHGKRLLKAQNVLTSGGSEAFGLKTDSCSTSCLDFDRTKSAFAVETQSELLKKHLARKSNWRRGQDGVEESWLLNTI
eukprot:GDKJ01022692.1.p1 GENE.GDKJ01022692.1~~GDKJ01022692.1.p1  ORF type:complete len:648 (-),score=150.27 GDKJ01022692.1:50-1993(-)